MGTVLITGAAKRIGKAMAIHLAQKNFRIALHYHHSEKEAKKLQKQIIQQKRRCALFQSDLSDPDAVFQLIQSVKKNFKDLSILINNASVFLPSRFLTQNFENQQNHFAVNTNAPYILSSEFARLSQKGQIINILDTHITQNQSSHAAYLLSKKSLSDITKMAAIALAPKIRVNAIAPGLILPPEGKGQSHLKRLAQKVPLKRKGELNNITQTIDFFLDNDYITGQTIFVDGGEHLI